ncbi:MAG TPA: YhcH/YjgK/YiaL family protein [Candidatus Cloacimonadota bacterium]|nr:YhcH/YjgK/YiaL family protein [Candidatus Cloacimonadota bacterium]HPM01109.1 YhcH/YjgK/YiaL family protein [Candidatus Cloacimonadota bacterium]
MIFDHISQFKQYISVHPLFRFVNDYISQTDLSSIPEGKHDIGHGITLGINEYMTRTVEESFIECHRKYIDIQMITCGSEQIGILPIKEAFQFPYDEEKDFQKLQGITDFISLKPSYFMIFFPQDGHMPMLINSAKPEKVRKLVFKVPAQTT